MTAKLKLLLVDDDPEISWGVGRSLTRKGHSVAICGNGLEALALLDTKEFDVLITDIQMPGLNGLELIEWVAAHRPAMRIVAITAFGCPALQQSALQRGAIFYLEKPFDPNVLIELLDADKSKDSFYGNVDHIDLFDYVQFVFVTMRKLVLKINASSGEEGLLYVQNGTVVHAQCGELAGEEAFYRLLSLKGGVFFTMPWCDLKEQTINKKGEFLLLEAARLKDEGAVAHPTSIVDSWMPKDLLCDPGLQHEPAEIVRSKDE